MLDSDSKLVIDSEPKPKPVPIRQPIVRGISTARPPCPNGLVTLEPSDRLRGHSYQ